MKRNWLLLILVASLLVQCKGKKASPTGEDPVEVSDFIEFFPEGKPPFEVQDTTLNRKEKDSLQINYKVFTQFVPDSVISADFKTIKPRIYPMRRIDAGADGSLLFAKAIAGEKKIAYLLSFNRENEFTDAMKLLQQDATSATQQVSGLDRKFQVYKNVVRKEPNGTTSEGKEVYIYSADAGGFMLIMTDALDEKQVELVNPIDTFSRKNKHSADYIKDKKNLVSIRDQRGGRFRFFIHIDKNNGECYGELKGEGAFKSANTGVYTQSGDPCSLQFTFTTSSVRITELSACGNRRGVKCTFDGVFPKKKSVVVKKSKN